MNVDITSPSVLAPNLISTVPSGLPVNRVPVITQPPPTNTSLESSIHVHLLPVSTNLPSNDKGKSVAFDIPTRQLSPDDIWAIICLGNSLRVCLASYSKAQRDFRREHVAILAGILKNIKEADLLKIASQVNAKAVNIPFSYNSYKLKPYAYLNFSSFESLEVAKELTIAFRNKGLTWHSLNEARNLCHVCGRHGCSPSTCSLRPAQTTNDRLDKLYSQFNAGLKHGQPDSRRTQSPSNSCSWSRSNSRSHNRTVTDRSNNSNRSIFSPSPARPHVRAPRSDIANSQHNANANVQSGFISGFSSPPSSQPMSSLPPDVIEELKSQLKDIAQQLKDLDEKVNWMEYSITDHDYRIKELESMMNYDDPPDNTSSHAPNFYSNDASWDYQQDLNNNNNNNIISSPSPVHADSNFSIMDTSPNASFSTLNPNSILASRHAPLPNRVNLDSSSNDSARLRHEISSVSNIPNKVFPIN
ncbi:hypothetical protein GLOIN_2v1770668 [Rhizophagus irregularis DAOM 181602=DAOM 197198]|nr:hypothetical protein GLOIN_2v1770668 [Rhizophagus irregularis DAOM 181602=DAOM 197198]